MDVFVLSSLVFSSTLFSSESSSTTVCVSTSSEVARAESVARTGECDKKLVATVEWNLGRLRLVLLLCRSGERKE